MIMNGEWVKGLDGRSRGLFYDTIPVFICTDRGKADENRTHYLPNTSLHVSGTQLG
jgi:hypothetical protein